MERRNYISTTERLYILYIYIIFDKIFTYFQLLTSRFLYTLSIVIDETVSLICRSGKIK